MWASQGHQNVNAIAPGLCSHQQHRRAAGRRGATRQSRRIPPPRGEPVDIGGAAVSWPRIASDYVHGTVLPWTAVGLRADAEVMDQGMRGQSGYRVAAVRQEIEECVRLPVLDDVRGTGRQVGMASLGTNGLPGLSTEGQSQQLAHRRDSNSCELVHTLTP